MHYALNFAPIWQSLPELMMGAANTLRLSLLAMVVGLIAGPLGAIGRISGPRALRWLIQAYVELIRNTPFLVQLFVIYLGLPRLGQQLGLGLRLSPDVAAFVALSVNLAAYAIEIMRAGIEAVPPGQIEAGRALGLHSWQIYRLIILVPAFRAVYPALAGQFVLLMLGTSVVSAIAAEELTSVANDIQSRTFRAFEVYFVVAGLYLALTLTLRLLFALGARLVIGRNRGRPKSRWIGA